MLDRTTAPNYSTVFDIQLLPLQTDVLSNAISISSLQNKNIEVFRLEIVFPFGLLHAPNFETGIFFPRIIKLGSQRSTAVEIAERLEELGGFFDISLGNRRTTFTLHGLSSYFTQYLDTLFEIIYEASFPEVEIEIQKKNAEQGYSVNVKKTSFIASKNFKEILFGQGSYLGQTFNETHIKQVERSSLVDFHNNSIHGSPFEVFLCGNYSQDHLDTLKNKIESITISKTPTKITFPEIRNSESKHIPMESSVQSTIILGKRLFSRNHPDFHKFLMTNTLLGGYFGSRLMKNIREEKGLTYGISSSLQSNGHDGVFSIKADLKKEKVEEVISEIEKEIDFLKNIPVSEDELSTVKNYINGNILGGTNTIFDIMDKHKAILYEELPLDFYEKLGKTINAISPTDISNTAKQYLNDLSTVIAG